MATSNATKKPVLASLEKTPPSGAKRIVTGEMDINYHIGGLKVSSGMPQDDALELASLMLAGVKNQLDAYLDHVPGKIGDAIEGTSMLVSVAKGLVDAAWCCKEVDEPEDVNNG